MFLILTILCKWKKQQQINGHFNISSTTLRSLTAVQCDVTQKWYVWKSLRWLRPNTFFYLSLEIKKLLVTKAFMSSSNQLICFIWLHRLQIYLLMQYFLIILCLGEACMAWNILVLAQIPVELLLSYFCISGRINVHMQEKMESDWNWGTFLKDLLSKYA